MPDRGLRALLDRPLRPVVATSLALSVGRVLQPRVPFAWQRRLTHALVRATAPVPRGVAVAREDLGGVTTERLTPRGSRADATVLYFHGGGFCIGSPAMHRPLGARLARALGAPVLVPDYRLAPEHVYPAALDDVLAVYRALLDRGVSPERTTFVGDSAGGGLALALLVLLRKRGLPLPASAVLLSPWVDLTLAAASLEFNAGKDAFLGRPWLARCAEAYRGDVAASDARVSPLFASLEGLPRLAIHVGTREVLLDDAARLAVRARDAGVDVQLVRYAGLWHNSQLQAALLPSAARSFADAGRFVRERWPQPIWSTT